MGVKLREIAGFLREQKDQFQQSIDDEEARINNLKTERLKKRALESLDKTIDTVYVGFETLLEKFANLLNEEIKINSH